jgi:hypothetical protein
MSDVAWARVERGLLARLDGQTSTPSEPPPRRRWTWLAVPVLAAAAVVIVVLALRTGPAAPPTGTEPIAGEEPSRVVAGEAPSSVSFGDAHVGLEARSAIVMTREGGSPSVLLERGAASFTVAPRNGRPPFVVRAGDTVVRVVGTQFRVARTDERIAVEVQHGIVDVLYRGNTVRVAADHAWRSEAPDAVTEIAMTTPPPAPAPQVPAPQVPAPQVPAPQVPAPQVPAVVVRPAPPTPPAVDPDRAKFDRLSRIEARDPDAALAGYLELSQGSSAWAAVGLFAAGRLAADRHDPRATMFLTIYLRRFPTGANASDATTLLQRLEGEHR